MLVTKVAEWLTDLSWETTRAEFGWYQEKVRFHQQTLILHKLGFVIHKLGLHVYFDMTDKYCSV